MRIAASSGELTSHHGFRIRSCRHLFESRTVVITILFDIDGTLIRSGGAGMKAIEAVMLEMFDFNSVNRVELGGRTDNGILTDLFESHSLSFDQHREEFCQKYWELLPSALDASKGSVLPGVAKLLEISRHCFFKLR